MIDFRSYNNIINYLNKDALEGLRVYLEVERQKYYLKNAREKLREFLKSKDYNHIISPCMSRLDDGTLLIINATTMHLLNSDELITGHTRHNLLNNQCDIIKESYRTFIGWLGYDTRDDVEFDKDDHYLIARTSDTTIEHRFNKDAFNYSEAFLEGNLEYSLIKEAPACIVRSSKGKAIVTGMRKNV